jgi:hypothetical protein
MSNDDIIRIAERAVSGAAFSTPRMSNRRRKSFEIILALALHVPESEWPVQTRSGRRRPSREQTERFEYLKSTRDKVAAELGSIHPCGTAWRWKLCRIPRRRFSCAGRDSCLILATPRKSSMPPEADIVAMALAEDIGGGDVTTLSSRTSAAARQGSMAREGCHRGWMWPPKFSAVDPEIHIETLGEGRQMLR